jgi:hypothetical protein
LGFVTCVLAKRAARKNKNTNDLQLVGVEHLRGLLPIFPGLCQTEIL